MFPYEPNETDYLKRVPGREVKPLISMAFFSMEVGVSKTAADAIRARESRDLGVVAFDNLCGSFRKVCVKKVRRYGKGRKRFHGAKALEWFFNSHLFVRARMSFRLEAVLTFLAESAAESGSDCSDLLMGRMEQLPTHQMYLLTEALLCNGDHLLTTELEGLGADALRRLIRRCFGQARDAVQHELTKEARRWVDERLECASVEADEGREKRLAVGRLVAVLGDRLEDREEVTEKRTNPQPIPSAPVSRRRKLGWRRGGRISGILAATAMVALVLTAWRSGLRPEVIFEWLKQPNRQEVSRLDQEAGAMSLDGVSQRELVFSLGWSNYVLGNYDAAQEKMMLLLDHEDSSLSLRARAHFTLGALHSTAWRLEQAAYHFDHAENLYDSLGNQGGVDRVRLERVAWLRRASRYDEALVLLEQLFGEMEVSARHYKLATNLHLERGELLEAFVYAEMWEPLANTFSEVLEAQSQQAYCFIMAGDLVVGRALTLKVQDLARTYGETAILYYNMINLIALDAIEGKDIRPHLDEVRGFAESTGNLDLIRHLDFVGDQFTQI